MKSTGPDVASAPAGRPSLQAKIAEIAARRTPAAATTKGRKSPRKVPRAAAESGIPFDELRTAEWLLAGAIWNERASWPSPADCGAEIERLRDCARREIELRGPAALRDLRIRGDWRDAKRRALPVRTDAEVVDEYARRSFIGFCRGHGIEDEFVDYVYASAVAGKWLQPHVDAGLGDVHEPSRYLPTTTTRRLRPAGRRGRVWSPWQLDEKWRAVEEAVRAEIHASGLKWSRSRVGQTWNAHDLAVRVQRRLPLWFPDDHDTLRTIEKWLRGPGAYVVLTA